VVAVASGGASVSAGALGAAGVAAEAVTFGAPLVLLAGEAWSRAQRTTPAAAAPTRQQPSVDDGHSGPERPLLTVPSTAPPDAAVHRAGADVPADGGVSRPVPSNPLRRGRPAGDAPLD
jgi:hypothetical protein